ncbi:mitochondrial sodium/calcium exchanger protein-like [Varroa jacobsoni]|uniref:mitochondrial sodium/calcium exchanger protein-like n=1 Tax=Varroa jacobsoni TaxID=62625 RepID=UPI000BF3A9D6|nr:mitochondrial sodium/calcium exchanger protein-like [Varroa jacobsoni]
MTEDVTWLFGPERAGTLNSSGSRCSDVWEVPASDRCTFALTVADCRSGEALLDYVELLYCRWQALPVPPLLPLIGLFLLCGGLVCALAGGFVSPALVLLKNRFQLDEAKAGATLLTLGNGIPDIMGAMAAVNMGHEGLVVGEVLGGTLFVVGVIIGTLYTVGGRAPLGRGFGGLLFFFALAVLYVGHIYVTGSVTGTHIAIGATIYVAYYAYIFSIPSKKESLALILSNSVNVNEKTPFLATNNVLYIPIDCCKHEKQAKPKRSLFCSFWITMFACLGATFEALAYCFQLPFSVLVPTVPEMEYDLAVSLISLTSSDSTASSTSSSFDSSSLSDCRMFVSFDWNQPRFVLYPWLLVTASGLASANDTALFAMLGLLAFLIYRIMCCIVPRQVIETLTTFAGFILSLCFLHRLTAEVVAVVRAMGLCTRLTDEVMGLSILTYGNFVGDISTYIAVVNRGCLRMALTGCISSAMLALIFNISLAFSMQLAYRGVWLCPLTRSTVTTVLMGAVALCPVLLALFAAVSRCHSNMTSGICLLFYYASIMILLIYTQL